MRADDLDAVVALEGESFSTPWDGDTFRKLLEQDRVNPLVLESEHGEILGYAVLWCVLDEGELANLAVRRDVRGRGLGRGLLDAVCGVARERGVRRLYLEVRESNERARHLYRRAGFREIGVREDYYRSPRESARVMELRLD